MTTTRLSSVFGTIAVSLVVDEGIATPADVELAREWLKLADRVLRATDPRQQGNANDA